MTAPHNIQSENTRVTWTCPKCRATEVPGSANNMFRLWNHAAGVPFSRRSAAQAARSARGLTQCRAEVFDYLLRNARLAVTTPGRRLMTDREMRAWRLEQAQADGRLF